MTPSREERVDGCLLAGAVQLGIDEATAAVPAHAGGSR